MSNQETTDILLWVNNDHDLYLAYLDAARVALATDEDATRHDVAQAIRAWWEDYTDPDNWTPEAFVRAIFPMVQDIGSAHRIDWDAVAWNAIDTLRENGEFIGEDED
jgi:hypothetical protein